MTGEPTWLPALVLMSDSGNDWKTYLECIYAFFVADFFESVTTFKGRRCSCKRYPKIDGKEGTFWHLISEGNVEADRLPDLRRCERIRWPKPIIERPPDAGVLVWTADRPGDKRRIVLALPDFSYVVVLADRGKYLVLWTAYHVDHLRRRDKLRKEFERHVARK